MALFFLYYFCSPLCLFFFSWFSLIIHFEIWVVAIVLFIFLVFFFSFWNHKIEGFFEALLVFL